MKKIYALIAATLVTTSSFAVLFETESNNTFGLANMITRGAAPWADVGFMSLEAGGGDVDFFKIHLDAGETITAITTPMDVEFDDPDTMMALYDPTFAEMDFNDDSNGFGSAVRGTATMTGDHYLAITGFGDFDFVGDHVQDGSYVLTVSVVPEPATMAALALGGAMLLRRRKK